MLSEALCKQDCRSGPLSSGNEDPVAQTIGHLDQLAESLRTTWRSTTCEVKFASGDDLINIFDLMEHPETCSIADAFANAELIPEAILYKTLSNTAPSFNSTPEKARNAAMRTQSTCIHERERRIYSTGAMIAVPLLAIPVLVALTSFRVRHIMHDGADCRFMLFCHGSSYLQ